MAQGTKAPAAANTTPTNGVLTGGGSPAVVAVNRKKQKRRAKQAARQAAEQGQTPSANLKNGHVPQDYNPSGSKKSSGSSQQAGDSDDHDYDSPDHVEHVNGEDMYDFDDDDHIYEQSNGATVTANGQSQGGYQESNKKSRKKKKKGKGSAPDAHDSTPSRTSQAPPPPPPPPPISESQSRPAVRTSSSKDRIWNTSTQEERERIKEFWLSLGEEERKSLVKIEKEAVLRKMKEQQKHSCSCTVCGRKRTAIEEELEVLYDAYYEELEQMPPDRMPPLMHAHPTPRNRIREIADEDEEEEEEEEDEDEDEEDEDEEEGDEEEGEDEEYSEEEDEDEDYSDDEPEELPRGPAAEFFNFGNSLTVKGGILTVADDLLKNDGKKFIEMMEQLAERRMQREEEAQYAAAGLSNPMQHAHAGHSHGGPPDDDEYDEEDEEEYDSQDEEYEEDEEADTMTEEQRMEEGRRMFQIFAARMFEQRVLTAYREKVARERQQKLLEELEEESRLDVEREEKKARDAQKRKEKKALQKQRQAEEKARKEAEKAAQEAAAKAAEQKRQEEQRRKKEEQRKKKEAERKAQEEERQRREVEKQRRLQEERERQQEAERKAREQRAQEKKAREEAKKKEREEREAREKEAREEKERKEREAKSKAEKETKERASKEPSAPQASQQATPLVKRPSQVAVALPPGLTKQTSGGSPSPHVPVATPAVCKAPTPVKPRQTSQQGSHASSPRTPQAALGPSKSVSPSSTGLHPPHPLATGMNKPQIQQSASLQHPQPSSPMHPLAPPGMQGFAGAGFGGIPPGLNSFPQSQGPLPGIGPRPSLGHNAPMFHQPPPPIGSQFRSYGGPGILPPPGMGVPPLIPHGRGFPMDIGPGFPQPIPGIGASQVPGHGSPLPSHTRQLSSSLDPVIGMSQAQPISRPAPIQRPSSVKPQESSQENKKPGGADADDTSNHLGSSALLDDSAEPLPSSEAERRASIQTSMPRPIHRVFGGSPIFPDITAQSRLDSFGLAGSAGAPSTWGTPPATFPSMAGSNIWGSPTSGIYGNSFNLSSNHHRPSLAGPILVRRTVCHACRELTSTKTGTDGYHDAKEVLQQVNLYRQPPDPPLQLKELLDICETEGDSVNGGGLFSVKREEPDRILIKFEEEDPVKAPIGLGEIGSPRPSQSIPSVHNGPRPFGGTPSSHF